MIKSYSSKYNAASRNVKNNRNISHFLIIIKKLRLKLDY